MSLKSTEPSTHTMVIPIMILIGNLFSTGAPMRLSSSQVSNRLSSIMTILSTLSACEEVGSIPKRICGSVCVLLSITISSSMQNSNIVIILVYMRY